MSPVPGSRPAAVAIPNNLPRFLTSFVGRESDIRSLKSLLGTSRMVTITGTGGAGKSRLAVEVARSAADAWPDGTWWIELAAANDVAGWLVTTLELPGRGPALQVVTSWLATKRALLVLDNCEQIVAACAAACQALLERCPELGILTTSREPLGVPGESRWPMTALSDADALHLFEARARLVRPNFSAGPQARVVTEICHRLDQLPLAIEMAAARLDLMSERELLDNLSDRFRVLASGARSAPERQQTMSAAIDWSHRLLTSQEATLFRRLSVFQGGFTLDAARAVCSDAAGHDTLSLLTGLVQKSMVVADRLDDGSTRYRLLESQHEFATEKLAQANELEEVRRRHFEYFGSLKWRPAESANFWFAVGWAVDNADDQGLGLALEIGNSDFSDQARALKLIRDLLERVKPAGVVRVKALTMAVRLAWRQADTATAKRLAADAVEAAREAGDAELLARALNGVGLLHETAGELALAGKMYDEAIALLDDPAHRRLAIDLTNGRGLLALAQGDPRQAHEILSRCVAFARAELDPPLLARYLESFAHAQLDLGEVDQAADSWREALSIFRGVNDWFGIIWSLIGLALVAVARREDDRMVRLAAAADRLSREYSLTTWTYRTAQLEAATGQARRRLGHDGRAQAAWNEGEAMTTREAIDYALGGAPALEAPLEPSPLSRREREVVVMIAAGMTNKQIAQRLFIAERTAEGHVERIRNKLGVRSRTEVATWAVEHRLGRQALDKQPPTSKV